MNAVADAERAERRVLARERDQRDLHEILPRQVVDRETHAVHRDRAVRNRNLPHRIGHMQVVHPCVDTPLDSPYHRDPVHVPLDDVAAQPVPRAQCTLQIHGAPHRVLAEQRTPLRRLHHVHRESTRQGPLDGETGAVHRDALALLQTLVGGLDREREPRFSFAVSRFPRRLRDSAHGTYDPGKHSRLSNTNNVSEPRALRSTGVQRGAAPPRTVSCGLSRSAVVPPTAIASNPARTQCTCSRAASPETHCELPAASAMRPSIDVASLRATNGRSACSRANRKGALSAAAASASRPIETATPLARSAAAPPRACGSGSGSAATTPATPAATIAWVHGGVLRWCAHGRRFTTSVAPRARAPAASSATPSAWGPPYSAW